MSEKNNSFDVTSDILVLYELSLAVGASLDLAEACEVFCHTVMVRKNLTYAAVWILGEHLQGKEDSDFSMVHSHPGMRNTRQKLQNDNEFFKKVLDQGFLSCSVDEAGILPGSVGGGTKEGITTWFSLADIGYLELVSANRTVPMDQIEMNKLRNVVGKFAISLKGCLAHGKMVGEYEERMRSEAALVSTRYRNQWLTDNVADVIWTIDENLKITFVSPAIKKFAGYSPEEMKTIELEEFLVPESMNQVQGAFQKLNKLDSDFDPVDLEMLPVGQTIDLKFIATQYYPLTTITSSYC